MMVGSGASVFAAFDKFRESLKDSGLVINTDKCGILWQHKDPVPPEIAAAAAQRGIQIHQGCMEVLGVLIGSGKGNFRRWLADRVNQHKELLLALSRHDLPAQISYQIIRQCLVRRLMISIHTL